MDYSRNSKFKSGLFILALMTMTACSSSQVDDGSAPPPETAGDAQPLEASTDAVPPAADPSAPVGEDPSLAGQAPPAAPALNADQPPGDPAAVADAGAPPMGDPSAIASDPSAAAPAPISDAPLTLDNVPGAAAPVEAPIASAPAPSAPVVETPSSLPAGEGVSYKVKRGDTLMKIAFENYGDLYRWKEIFEANRAQITDPNAVPPGTQLTLNGAGMVSIERNGERYLIKRGDTLGIISNDVYGTPKKWKKLWENNRQLIKNPNHIYAGF
ncbi:MAG: LysM peptidoglycan-binding domain-containing protein, partial [Bdellovibrionales bacterium]|nr:LysM peptidoglycan-binding domain-containing protein [Oligoflexia bacterium]